MALLVIKDKEFFMSHESDYIACKSKLPYLQIELEIYYWLYCEHLIKAIKYYEWCVK